MHARSAWGKFQRVLGLSDAHPTRSPSPWAMTAACPLLGKVEGPGSGAAACLLCSSLRLQQVGTAAAAGAWSRGTSLGFPETFPRGPRGAFPFALALFKQARCLDTAVHAPSLKASLMTFSKGPSQAAKPTAAGACVVWLASCLHADFHLIGVQRQQPRRWALDKSNDYSPPPGSPGCVQMLPGGRVLQHGHRPPQPLGSVVK